MRDMQKARQALADMQVAKQRLADMNRAMRQVLLTVPKPGNYLTIDKRMPGTVSVYWEERIANPIAKYATELWDNYWEACCRPTMPKQIATEYYGDVNVLMGIPLVFKENEVNE